LMPPVPNFFPTIEKWLCKSEWETSLEYLGEHPQRMQRRK
jgi:hypothetical protein